MGPQVNYNAWYVLLAFYFRNNGLNFCEKTYDPLNRNRQF